MLTASRISSSSLFERIKKSVRLRFKTEPANPTFLETTRTDNKTHRKTILDLPDTVLSLIFLECFSTSRSYNHPPVVNIPDICFGGANPDYLRYALQSTCKKWADVVKGCCQLWCIILLESDYPVEALQRCVTLSNNLPLEVYVRPWALGKLSHPLMPHLTLLKSECHRIRKFMAGHMNHEELIHFFPIIPGQVNEFPLMEAFYLSGYTSRINITEGLPMGLIYAPNLRHLELGEAYLVECFMTTTFIPLCTLVLSSHRCLIPALIILHFISLCPNITALKLDIWNAYDADIGWPPDRITLPKLQDLWFYANSTNNTMYLLRSLHMPRLLRVDFGERYPQNILFRRQLFSHVLLETSPTLENLSINRNSFPSGSNLIEPLLIRMDHLRMLSFVEIEVVPSVLDLLVPPKGWPPEDWPLPRLETLSFKHADLPGDSLIKVILGRSIPDSVDHSLSKDCLCQTLNHHYLYLSEDEGRQHLNRGILRSVIILQCSFFEDTTFAALLGLSRTHSHIIDLGPIYSQCFDI